MWVTCTLLYFCWLSRDHLLTCFLQEEEVENSHWRQECSCKDLYCEGLYQLRNCHRNAEGLEVTAFSIAKEWWSVKIFLAHHHLPLYYQFWWDGASAFQDPWWHRNCNKNARKKSPDCLALLELRVSSSALGVFFPPVLEKHAADLPNSKCTGIWSLCLLLFFRSSWQGEDATKTSIFTLVEPESQTESCERDSKLQSPCSAFYTQPDMQPKNKPKPQNKAKPSNQNKNRC